ncbi:MAG: hypothetical protein AABM67_14710 [Acidobacteriota bacterium]
MRTNRLNLAIASGLLTIAMLACNFSTANISSLKIGKDKTVSKEFSTFAATDQIFAVATISNAPGKVKVKGVLAFDDVPGQQTGPVPGFEKTLELDGSGTATFTLTPPPDGWAPGKYKVEVIMMNESGEQKDQKTVTFTVS